MSHMNNDSRHPFRLNFGYALPTTKMVLLFVIVQYLMFSVASETHASSDKLEDTPFYERFDRKIFYHVINPIDGYLEALEKSDTRGTMEHDLLYRLDSLNDLLIFFVLNWNHASELVRNQKLKETLMDTDASANSRTFVGRRKENNDPFMMIFYNTGGRIWSVDCLAKATVGELYGELTFISKCEE